jgi:preprotein translocase subunit SecD
MKKLLTLMAACLITSGAAFAAPSTSSVFQIRLVLDAPAGDSEPMTVVSKERKEVMNVQKTVLLDQTALKSAGVRTDALGHARIEITFADEGRKRFAEITRAKVGQRLAIIVDGRLYCAPTIRTEIPGGKAEINGSFSKVEANTLAAKIIEAIPKH